MRLKKWYVRPLFYKHTLLSYLQAKKTPGHICTKIFVDKGWYSTLTAWEDKKSMMLFAYGPGAHKKAIKQTKKIAKEGIIYTYENDTIPTWPDAIELLHKNGRIVLPSNK